jgi:hypothetical protein
MKIEGTLTSTEINAAVRFGASIQKLCYNRTRVTFQTEEVYRAWDAEQARLRPYEWELKVPRKM